MRVRPCEGWKCWGCCAWHRNVGRSPHGMPDPSVARGLPHRHEGHSGTVTSPSELVNKSTDGLLSSFPRKRESRFFNRLLDPGFRRGDEYEDLFTSSQ